MGGVELREVVAPVDRNNPRDLHGLDAVYIGEKRVAFCPHCEGAVVRFVRLPASGESAEAVRAEVARLREEAGRWPISDRTMQPPDPQAIRRHEQERKAKKR